MPLVFQRDFQDLIHEVGGDAEFKQRLLEEFELEITIHAVRTV